MMRKGQIIHNNNKIYGTNSIIKFYQKNMILAILRQFTT